MAIHMLVALILIGDECMRMRWTWPNLLAASQDCLFFFVLKMFYHSKDHNRPSLHVVVPLLLFLPMFLFLFPFFFCILITVKMIIDRVGAGFSPIYSHLGKPASSTRTHHQSDRVEDLFLAYSTYVYLFFLNLNHFFVTSQMVFKEYCY